MLVVFGEFVVVGMYHWVLLTAQWTRKQRELHRDS